MLSNNTGINILFDIFICISTDINVVGRGDLFKKPQKKDLLGSHNNFFLKVNFESCDTQTYTASDYVLLILEI